MWNENVSSDRTILNMWKMISCSAVPAIPGCTVHTLSTRMKDSWLIVALCNGRTAAVDCFGNLLNTFLALT